MNYDYPHVNDSEITDTLEDTSGSDKPRILLMGLQRSGKSSIQRVVFGKMPPNDTLYLESTTKIQKEDITRSFIDFQIWDFPGQVNFFDMAYDSQEIFGAVGALIFVIDAQDDYSEALHRLFFTVTSAYRVNQNISFEVLIHKVDGLSDDYKIDTQRDVQQRMSDMLADAQLEHIHLSYYLTSIYDHSIYEAFSKIIQKLIRELPTLENLLNVLCQNSGIDKAYLFDTLTKIYIATDSSPVDMQSYELCSDMIDVIIDIECIYGAQVPSPNGRSSISDEEDEYGESHHVNGNGNGTRLLRDPYNGSGNNNIVNDDDEGDGGGGGGDGDDGDDESQEQSLRRADGVGLQNEAEASSLIKLDNGDVLYMREVNRLLVLICLLRHDNFEKHGLIDYNFQCFKEAVTEVFEFSQKRNSQQQEQQQQQQMTHLAQQQSNSE
ncbi:Gtr1/RagA G protein conserved region-domain-containing protein [Zychaea mexicana]|uniref:Gtr1/RagA G protein conserved region-domain-containing protein n=1 Tax=Zychaea mexicana TaxID=64656 RepID=UPI0022FE65C0|nr:Gtr1/RagA G protein conserved region-domain-containing protein [Zychaea mexicana]KAI9493456.1 Gtr1/RagA G protein conserved region-domain-containing protein [Zychaea mexicana]